MTRNNTIHGSLLANASERPDRIVLLWESHRVTWEDLSVETRKIAYLMADSTPGPGALVGTWGSSAPLHMIALLAAGLAGYTHVPLNPRWSRSFLQSITRNLSLVLTDGRLLPNFRLPLISPAVLFIRNRGDVSLRMI
jgi:acyl-CoA synthetase (AMP-forming)/AMP-acid ligase II